MSMPLPPGTDTMEAFTRNGVVMLQELYHMACSACCIAPAATAPLDSCGGALAYSFLLGPEIESGWSSDFAFPGDDPCNIGSHYLRALTTQTPDKSIVSTAHKVRESLNVLVLKCELLTRMGVVSRLTRFSIRACSASTFGDITAPTAGRRTSKACRSCSASKRMAKTCSCGRCRCTRRDPARLRCFERAGGWC